MTEIKIIKGFVAHSHADRKIIDEFMLDLRGLEFDYSVKFWIDDGIPPGDRWEERIKENINESDIFLLMMSRSFLGSDFIRTKEWKWIRERELSAHQVIVVPVILDDSRWDTYWGGYEAVPKLHGLVRPVTRWEPLSEGLTRAAEGVERALTDTLGLMPIQRPVPQVTRNFKQVPSGVNWFLHERMFRIDTDSEKNDGQIAEDSDIKRRFDHVRDTAERLADAAVGLEPEVVPANLMTDLRRLSELCDRSNNRIANTIIVISDVVRALSGSLKVLRTRRERGYNAPTLNADWQVEFENLIAEAVFCLRHFPSVRNMDGMSIQPNTLPVICQYARRIINFARDLGLVGSENASTISVSLSTPGIAPDQQTRAVMGLRNLLCRVGSFALRFVPCPIVRGDKEDALLLRSVCEFLIDGSQDLRLFFQHFTSDISGSFDWLISTAENKRLVVSLSTMALGDTRDNEANIPNKELLGFSKSEVELRLLRAETVPKSWVPLTTDLSFINKKSLTDLRHFSTLNALRYLYLSRTGVSDLRPLSGLTSIRTIYLNDTQIDDLSPLMGLRNLHFLGCNDTLVYNLAPLARLESLQSLFLNRTRVNDLTPLCGLTSMRFLHFASTDVSDLVPLCGMAGLLRLDIESTNITNLAPLAGLTKLTELYASHSKIDDIKPLGQCRGLRILSLYGTAVTDLSPISKLPALEVLRIDGTGVRDLRPLAQLRSLRTLRLDGTQVRDLTPLSNLNNLQFLSIHGTPVTDVTPLRHIENLSIEGYRRP